MKVMTLSTKNFESEIEKSNLPVIVDFWAPWCGPCRMMTPVIEELASELDGKVKVCKVNIDDEPNLAAKYSVMSIPTIVLIKNNKVAASAVGAMKKEELLKKLEL